MQEEWNNMKKIALAVISSAIIIWNELREKTKTMKNRKGKK